MGFYQSEPFTHATATYVWTGLRTPGFFIVDVEGDAPNYTSGIQLVRDPQFVGGLKVDVMGWTGPIAEGTSPYKVTGTFPGEYRDQVIVTGGNAEQPVQVKEIPADEAEDYLAQRAQALTTA